MTYDRSTMASGKFAPGKHVLIDLYGAKNLTKVELIKDALQNAATICGAEVLNTNLHSFGENAGVTGVALLAESHISIHTWPELDYAAIDIFMCGNCEPELAIEPLKQFFNANDSAVNIIHRGQNAPSSQTQKTA
ncbi:adenosylmethionine decarboxylase [Glaciecola petra]|uniref:Adenosylmethionine decarboxylase n=1 Tax=Glaciecola petra TaxID=3075602 RepID=A0ABU2ZVG8_9ALTE|nr:adenosylmethionine decarboxylase [Aestuariibacter sp. P117]MDT0596643.1 adenosylmethionine decarboxylase [Aestuariibacter sp. P117]